MEIVIAAAGLPFGPDTIDHYSLGGSETAALQVAKELRKLGHLVTIFCNLPQPGRLDYIENGAQDDLGVRYVSIEQYMSFVANTEIDLLVVSRDPRLLQVPHQAKKAVLWMHDLMTYNALPHFMDISWNVDEMWTVSQFHADQVHKISGYPKSHITPTRNGIVKFDDLLPGYRVDKSLLYSARPERGLHHLVCPGGIMDRLPDFTLNVTMYDNFPEHMKEYYHQLFEWAGSLPNVNLLGPKTQKELRQIMRDTWLYVYPTHFEEVSCILAREAMEQGLPFLTTEVGAIEETLGDCGLYYGVGKDQVGGEEFCEKFAQVVKNIWETYEQEDHSLGWWRAHDKCLQRTDLYWDEVAKDWEEKSAPKKPSTFSHILSLIKDSDVIPAKAMIDKIEIMDEGEIWLSDHIEKYYPFLTGDITLPEYYKLIYEHEDKKQVPERQEMRTLKGAQRYNAIAEEVYKLPVGSRVLDYGCAEGPIILQLAQDFPDKHFIGVDFVESNIALCKLYSSHHGIQNAEFHIGQIGDMPNCGDFDAAIVSEVLEHTEEPWKITDEIEKCVKLDGRLILTVPQGPWEWEGLTKSIEDWPWRAHIWHINKWMLQEMYKDKEECTMSCLSEGISMDGRAKGHLIMSYKVDHSPACPIDPLEKASRHRCRQSISAAMIAMNEEANIPRALNSLGGQIDELQIALAPSSDNTRLRIQEWADKNPWVRVNVIDVPKIENKKFGFDDARNLSIEGLNGDWIFWIDCDEYLSGDQLRMYAKNNAFDSYAIYQHHFTVDPRGAPAQMDKPARMFRSSKGFKFFGKVHEHAEIGFNGGPGFVMILPSIDIGHSGYVNDWVRQRRFERNFPLLEWDQEVYPDRKLGTYLWLRDIIHRMRILDSYGRIDEARNLAKEALDYYHEHRESWGGIGGGIAGNQALVYYGEALKYLGMGYEVTVQLAFEGQSAQYNGRFTSAEDALELAKKSIQDQIEKRESGYFQ